MSSVSAVNTLLSSTAATTPSVDISSLLASSVGATTPGIDVNAAVSAAIYAARAPERQWQAQQATLSSQTAALTAVQTAVTTLATDMTSLNTLTGPLSARTVNSSNSSSVTATATTGTITGNHSVVVNSLATTGSWYSDLAASPTAALPATSFTLTTKTGTATITTGSGVNSLNDVATSINAQTSSLGVTASVVSDSTGSRLAIISTTNGNAGDFSIKDTPYSGTSWSSPSFSSSIATLGVNTFTLTMSGVTNSITTTSGETFNQLATDINTQNPGVTASVVSDPNGFHLAIASKDGTTPFTFSEPSFGFSQAAVGANASLTVDGVPVSSASNTVTGAISGVTLNLLNTTSRGTVNLAVASDTTQVSTAINKFVSDYNTAIGLVNSQFTYNGSSQGVLGSDPTVRSLQASLMQVLSYVNTPATGTTAISTLGSLGITTGQDGTLSIDATTMNNALANSASDVQNFFQGASLNGFANSLTSGLSSFTNPGTGSFTVDLSSISKTSADLATHISTFESVYIAQQQTLLTAMYSKAEIALQQLPTQMAQIQAELGNNTKSGG